MQQGTRLRACPVECLQVPLMAVGKMKRGLEGWACEGKTTKERSLHDAHYLFIR